MVFKRRFFCSLLYIFLLVVWSNKGGYCENQDDNIKPFLTFVKQYSPAIRNENNGHNALPEIDDDIRESMYMLKSSDNKLFRESIVLIMLKLYRTHLQCCNQSYDIRVNYKIDSIKTPVLYEFLNFSKAYSLDKPIEFLSSSIAYDWVNKNRGYLENKNIRKEFTLIQTNIDRINNGI